MDNKPPVPFSAFEGEQTRAEIRDKRKDRIIVVLIITILLNNLAWLWFFNQFDIATDTVTQGTDAGDNSYIGAGASGYITNGESDDN